MAGTPSERGAGRPRSELARQAILDAAFQLVTCEGFQVLTIEGIARAAGVGKPTIYRWWPSKGAVVFEALLQHAEQTIPISDAMPEVSLADSVVGLLQALFKTLNENTGDVVRGLMAEAQLDPVFAELFRKQFIAVRRQPLLTLLRKGIESGELVQNTKIEVLADLIYGAMWYRLLAQHAPLDDEFAFDIVQTSLRPLLLI